MDAHGEPEKNDLVIVEGTNDENNGRAGRVVDQLNTVTTVRFVRPDTGEVFNKLYDTELVGVITEDGPLLIERCCSVCAKLNWDNRTGGYGEKHLNQDTGVDQLCNEEGLTYVDGERVPDVID